MDAKVYAAGEKAGRESESADSNPHTTRAGDVIMAIVCPVLAPMLGGDDSKASDWARGHEAGSNNKKK